MFRSPLPACLSLLLLLSACAAEPPSPTACHAYRSASGGRTLPDGGTVHSDCECADPGADPLRVPRCLECQFVQYGDGTEDYLCLKSERKARPE